MVAALTSARAQSAPLVEQGTFLPTVFPPWALDDPAKQTTQQLTRLFPEPASRSMFAMATYGPASFGGSFRAWITAYHLDTLKPLGGGISVDGFVTAQAVDSTVGGFLVSYTQTNSGGRVWIDRYTATPGGGVKRQSTIDLTTSMSGLAIAGLYRPPNSTLLYVIAERAGRAIFTDRHTGGTTLAEIELDALAPTVKWTLPLPDCFAPMQAPAPRAPAALGYVPEKDALYFGCSNDSSPVRRGVARVTLSGRPENGATPAPPVTAFKLFGRDGDFSRSGSFFDPGARRLVFDTQTSSGGASVYVFDAISDTYVGGVAVGANQLKQAGLDPVKGRFYGGSPDENVGLVLSDIRTSPVSQGASMPELRGGGTSSPSDAVMAIDPPTNRVFVKYEAKLPFTIFEDTLPPYSPHSIQDLDQNTIDVEEAPGVTRATYSASAQGYGARVRQVGGIQAMQLNYVGIRTPLPVGPGTRESRFAFLNEMRLANEEATSAAISADRDSNTQGDIDKGSVPGDVNDELGTGYQEFPEEEREDVPEELDDARQGLREPAASWPIRPAVCLDFGGSPGEDSRDDSTVSCSADNHHASASSKSGQAATGGVSTAAPGGGSVLVESSTMNASTRLDPRLGVVSNVRSTARGVNILGGLLRVSRVEVEAESAARGRTGTARSDFTRSVEGVFINGVEQCGKNCNTTEVAKAVNEQLAGRIRVDFPEPDEATRATKGGFQALVRRDRFEHLEQVILSEQPTTRIEVPGMVITLYEDASVPSRTILELAAAGTEARYGISLLSEDGGGGDGGDGGLVGGSGSSGGFGPGDVSPPFGLSPTSPVGVGKLTPFGGTGSPIGDVATGRLLLNGFGRLLDLLPIWAVLLAPVYLSARRWLLLQRSSLVSGGTR